MKRKRRHLEEQENHERWLVSYADFVTLLFGFFVVMYAISSVNEGKYRVLSDSLNEAFSSHDVAEKSDQLIQIGQRPTTIQPIQLDHLMTEQEEREEQLSVEIKEERRRLKRIAEQFKVLLEPYINQKLIEVKRNDFWLELELKSGMLFKSGEAELSKKAIPFLKKIAEILRQTHNVLHVEGHTDNVPIDTVEFPSNWDLSSARATSVVQELVNDGINPKRLAAVGYGEFHPKADNKSKQGRFENRRVVLVLISQSIARYKTNKNERVSLSSSVPERPVNE
jgi:chemotaxis protein MotB